MAYEVQEARKLVQKAGLELKRTGLIARTWGNISARISETQFVITPSGRAYEDLTPEDMVVVNIADGSYEGSQAPSSEKLVHAAAYQIHPEVNFVIHTHQDYATDLSTLGADLTVPSDLQAILGSIIPVAEYGMFSTPELAENVERALQASMDSRAVLMRNHGTVCLGKSYEDAFRIAHMLEDFCRKKYFTMVGKLLPEKVCTNLELPEYEREFSESEQSQGKACLIFTDAPYIKKASSFGKDMEAYVDDLAMMIGPCVKCVDLKEKNQGEINPNKVHSDAVNLNGINSDENNSNEMKTALQTLAEQYFPEDCGAILLKNHDGGVGALCKGKDHSDAEAMVMVLDKGCQVALLKFAGKNPAAAPESVRQQEHEVYMTRYSKLK